MMNAQKGILRACLFETGPRTGESVMCQKTQLSTVVTGKGNTISTL